MAQVERAGAWGLGGEGRRVEPAFPRARASGGDADLPWDAATSGGVSGAGGDEGLGADLTRRLGLAGRMRVAVACAVVVLAVGGFAVARSVRMGGGFEVMRTEADASGGDAVAADASDELLAGEDAASGGHEDPLSMVVHVDGAVCAPGVYRVVGDDPRVSDAVDAAGGLAEGADTSAVNLAEPLSDGVKVHIPAVGEAAATYAATGDVGAGGAQAGGAQPAGMVNVNTATAAELMSLPGIGEVTAAAIVADRERRGPFASVEDLKRVDGIGDKRFEKIRERVCV